MADISKDKPEIEDILLEEDPGAGKPYTPRKVVLDAFSVPPQINEVLDSLRRWDISCMEVSADFREIVFSATDEDMMLTPSTGVYTNKPIYFMRDPDNPGASKILHAQKQFCKVLGIPHGFFVKNRPSLRMNIVRTWQAGLQINDKETMRVLRLRDGQDCGILRAILPTSAVPLKTSEVLLSVLHGLNNKATVLLVHGNKQDDLIFHIRLLTGQAHTLATGQTIEIGIALTASELGACPLFFDVFIRDQVTGAYFMTSYAGEPFFSSKYTGLQHTDLVDLLTKAASRVNKEIPEVITALAVSTTIHASFEMRSEFHRLCQGKGLTTKFKQALFHQMNEAQDQIRTSYDVACQASMVAQGLDIVKRLEAERRIGQYLNLAFSAAH